MTSEAARRVGVNWREPRRRLWAKASSEIWTAPLNPKRSVLISSFRYYPLNIQIEPRILKRLLYLCNF
jgi:hypothetical protein